MSATATVGPFAVQVQDQYGNPVTNTGTALTLTLSTTSTGTTGHTPFFTPTRGRAGAAVTIANGASTSSTFYYSDTKAGTPTISVAGATVNGQAVTGTSTGITMVAGTASSLSLSAATTTPTAGAGDNLTITALDTYGNTATGYTGSKTLSFTGASAIGTTPDRHQRLGHGDRFGSTPNTAITFNGGVATVSGSDNGVMTLYKSGTSSIVVSDGTINNGTGLSVTVGLGSTASLSLSAATTTPTAGAGDNLTITALDTYGNTATGYTGSQDPDFSGANASPIRHQPDRHQRLGHGDRFNSTRTRPSPSTPDRPRCPGRTTGS